MSTELDGGNPESTDLTERIRARKAALDAEREAEVSGGGDAERENEIIRQRYRDTGQIQHRA